jgi:DNA-binding transcriptional regulator YdaS (Cro superfamily)
MRIYMQKALVQRALAKAGSVKNLAAALRVSRESVHRWIRERPMLSASEAKLKEYLNV